MFQVQKFTNFERAVSPLSEKGKIETEGLDSLISH